MERELRLLEAVRSFCSAISDVEDPFSSFSMDDLETLFDEFLEADQCQFEDQLLKENAQILQKIERRRHALTTIKNDYGRESNELALTNAALRRKVNKREKLIEVKRIIWKTQVRKIEDISRHVQINLPFVRRSLHAKLKELNGLMYAAKSDIAATASNNLVTIGFARQSVNNELQALANARMQLKSRVSEEISEISVQARALRNENRHVRDVLFDALLMLDDKTGKDLDSIIEDLIQKERSDALFEQAPFDGHSEEEITQQIVEHVHAPLEEMDALISELANGFAIVEDTLVSKYAI